MGADLKFLPWNGAFSITADEAETYRTVQLWWALLGEGFLPTKVIKMTRMCEAEWCISEAKHPYLYCPVHLQDPHYVPQGFASAMRAHVKRREWTKEQRKKSKAGGRPLLEGSD